MPYYTRGEDCSGGKVRRRRVVNCVGPEEGVAVETYYADDSKSNDPLRYTTCMSHHIMARIEDDVKRAKMREENPDSAIPSKGFEYDMDAYRAVEEYRTTQQLPRGSNVVTAMLYTPPRTDFFLPAISPKSNISGRNSNSTSRQPSHGTSTVNSPSHQGRRSGGGPPTKARRSSPVSRASSRVSQYPGTYRSRSSLKHNTPNGRSSNSNSGSTASSSASPQPRMPAGGRLQPLDGVDLPTASQLSGFHDDSRAVERTGQSPKKKKRLFLEPSSFEDEGADTAMDAKRQRRLRLAEKLARQMDAERV